MMNLSGIPLNFSISLSQFSADAVRVKRQSDDKEKKSAEEYEQELCKDKDAGEWFRLVAQEGDGCRDVIQCTTSVSDKYPPIRHL